MARRHRCDSAPIGLGHFPVGSNRSGPGSVLIRRCSSPESPITVRATFTCCAEASGGEARTRRRGGIIHANVLTAANATAETLTRRELRCDSFDQTNFYLGCLIWWSPAVQEPQASGPR